MIHKASVSIPLSDQEQIQELGRILDLGTPALVSATGERMELPHRVYDVLKDVVHNMEKGCAISLIPEKQQVSTQRAADILGVSRPHLVSLLESDKIPYHHTGKHRRLFLEDIFGYLHKRDANRRRILNALAVESTESGIYEGTPIPEGGSDE